VRVKGFILFLNKIYLWNDRGSRNDLAKCESCYVVGSLLRFFYNTPGRGQSARSGEVGSIQESS